MRKTFVEGFTLVELSLSMVFIGILSVAIVLIISNTISSYQRGLTLNQINTNGMALVDDMRTALQNASSKSVQNECLRFYEVGSIARERCLADNDGEGFVTHTRTGTVSLPGLDDNTSHTAELYGVFCSGEYSYIWNSGYYGTDYASVDGKRTLAEKRRTWATLTYWDNGGTSANGREIQIVGSLSGYYDANGNLDTTINGDGTVGDPNKPFRLLKVMDKERAICGSVVRNNTNSYGYEVVASNALSNNFVVNNGVGEKYTMYDASFVPVDLLLADGENDLALYDLYAAPPAESATRKNSFYAVSFILGTMRGGANVFAQGKNCEVPSNYATEDFNYCAINKFSFAVQAGGE